MKLSEIKGTDAIDVIADILDPITVIMADKEIQAIAKQTPRPPAIVIAKTILKNQKAAILEILARLNGEDPETFNPSLIKLPFMLMELIKEISKDEDLASLFHGQPQMSSSVPSGAVMPTTEETETM